MNVWNALKNKLEKITGLSVISLPAKDDTIQTGQIILVINSVELVSYPRSYAVQGELCVKTSCAADWQVLTDLLDLELTGTAAIGHYRVYEGGFAGMAVQFNILLHQDHAQDFIIKEVEL